jgi:hypothetical protein
MPSSFTLNQGDNQFIARIRTTLGGSIPTKVFREVEQRNKFGDLTGTKRQKLKLKGVAFGNNGLVFTFDDNSRHILEPGDKLNITYKHVPEPYSGYDRIISFLDSKGVKVRIIKSEE